MTEELELLGVRLQVMAIELERGSAEPSLTEQQRWELGMFARWCREGVELVEKAIRVV